MNSRATILRYGIGGYLLLFAFLYLFPYIWMTAMSFKADAEVFSGKVFPEHPTLEQYQRLFYGYQYKDVTLTLPYATYYKNTIIVTVTSLVLVLFFDALAAYAFAKFNFRGKKVLFWLMIGTMLLPVYATLIP